MDREGCPMSDDKDTPTRSDIKQATGRLFEFLLDWFPDIIWSADSDGKIVYCNKKAGDLLGYTQEVLLKKSVRDLYAPEILKNIKKGMSSLKEKGTFAVESVLIHKDGETRIPVEIRSFAVYDDNGEFLRTFSILRDIRQIKELQQSLVHAGRLAAIGELAACIAHDISNPLAVVGLYGELAELDLQSLEGNAEGKQDSLVDAVTNIRKAAKKIEKLVHHLTGFTRSTEPEQKEVILQDVIDDGMFMVANKFKKSTVQVTKDVPEVPCVIIGDANQLEQVFMNLFSNACDALKEVNNATLHVAISPHTEKTGALFWECQVADSGTGMPPEVASQIFNSFFTTKGKGKGTGLGLSISQGIVARHKGTINVESEPGKGTTFKILLPQMSPKNNADQLVNDPDDDASDA